MIPGFTLDDPDGDGFSDRITFDAGLVTLSHPDDDALFADAGYETVFFSELMLDPDAYISGSVYDFAPTMYEDGFSVYDDDQTQLFRADLSLSSLHVNDSTASINPTFGINLSEIETGIDYVSGTSEIVDAFVALGQAAVNLTLQIPGMDLGRMIEQGQTGRSTASGSAAANPVPEPTTVLLLGAGLLGITVYRRRHFRK